MIIKNDIKGLKKVIIYNINRKGMEEKQEQIDTPDEKILKNTKGNRYYYRHREEILEKKRLIRLAKKGVDITIVKEEPQLSLEERRKKKMEFLGVLASAK